MHRLRVLALCAGVGLAGCGYLAEKTPESSQQALVTIDPTKVPDDLRSLVSIVQEWGIGDDVDRGRKVDAASPDERARLRQALTPYHTRITAWLDSFGATSLSEEAAAFMYAQLALDEIDAFEGHERP